MYDWHIDDNRGVSINLLLTHDNVSHTMFTDEPYELVKRVAVVKYAPLTYYAFNSQCPHMVVNVDKPRYVMSLEFKRGKPELTFDQLINEIKHLYTGE